MIKVNLIFTEIPLQDIKQFPRTDEKITIDGIDLVASKMDIVLDSTNSDKYDDRCPGSLFYGVDWYNKPAEVYDGDILIWKGRIKNIEYDEGKKEVKIETHNIIRDMADTTCVYTSTDDITWAEHIRNILQMPGYMAISNEDILESTFLNAISFQTARKMFGKVKYTKADNINVLPVVTEICKISQSHLYASENRLGLYQWRPFRGEYGISLTDKHIIAGSYKHTFEDKYIYNDYYIITDEGTVEDHHIGSINRYGRRHFTVPDEDKPAEELRLLYTYKEGAESLIDILKNRSRGIRKICQWESPDSMANIRLNTQVDLTFKGYPQNEPVRIIERRHDRENRRIRFKAEYLNIPMVHFERDTSPPAAVILLDIVKKNGFYELSWTKSPETDHVGYLLYFTPSFPEWEGEFSSQGVSPINILIPTVEDNIVKFNISGLIEGATYYFKVVSFDVSQNSSEDSNIIKEEIK